MTTTLRSAFAASCASALLFACACSDAPSPAGGPPRDRRAVVADDGSGDELTRVDTTVDGPTEAKGDAASDLVLLNDLAMDVRQWTPLIPTLARGHRVIGWNSKAGDGVAELSKRLDALGAKRVHVVASGESAELALELALAQPARVRSLLLLAPDLRSLPASPKTSARERDLLALPPADFAAAVVAQPTFLPVGGWDTPLRFEAEKLVAAHADAYRAALRERTARPEAARVELKQLSRFEKVAPPVLVVVSANDDTHVGDVAEALQRTIGGTIVEWLTEGGHLPQLETPAPLLARLAEWFKEKDAEK